MLVKEYTSLHSFFVSQSCKGEEASNFTLFGGGGCIS